MMMMVASSLRIASHSTRARWPRQTSPPTLVPSHTRTSNARHVAATTDLGKSLCTTLCTGGGRRTNSGDWREVSGI